MSGGFIFILDNVLYLMSLQLPPAALVNLVYVEAHHHLDPCGDLLRVVRRVSLCTGIKKKGMTGNVSFSFKGLFLPSVLLMSVPGTVTLISLLVWIMVFTAYCTIGAKSTSEVPFGKCFVKL